jgi:hypothetical protein
MPAIGTAAVAAARSNRNFASTGTGVFVTGAALDQQRRRRRDWVCVFASPSILRERRCRDGAHANTLQTTAHRG